MKDNVQRRCHRLIVNNWHYFCYPPKFLLVFTFFDDGFQLPTPYLAGPLSDYADFLYL
jgi:hypothetical protein